MLRPEIDPSGHGHEISEIERRYAKRRSAGMRDLYDPILRCNALWKAELYVETAALLHSWLGQSRKLGQCAILEIGCGAGDNLLDMIRLGAEPTHLFANELLPERLASARRRLPQGVTFFPGDALGADIAAESIDLALQFTVFSSILNHPTRRMIAERIWSWLKPGGAMLSYDFVYDNPGNPDVAKLTVAELRDLFPGGVIEVRRVTLAPPIARRVAPISPTLFSFLNLFPFLRSHALCLIRKA